MHWPGRIKIPIIVAAVAALLIATQVSRISQYAINASVGVMCVAYYLIRSKQLGGKPSLVAASAAGQKQTSTGRQSTSGLGGFGWILLLLLAAVAILLVDAFNIATAAAIPVAIGLFVLISRVKRS